MIITISWLKKDHAQIRGNFELSDLDTANSEHQKINYIKPTIRCQLKKLRSQTFLFLYWDRCLFIKTRFNYQEYCTHGLHTHAQIYMPLI